MPEGWAWARLNNVGLITDTGYPFNASEFSKDQTKGMAIIRIRDILRGYSETYSNEKCPESYIVNKGEILIGMDGDFNIAKWKSEPALLNQRVCRIKKCHSSINLDYFFYLLEIPLKEINKNTSSVTVKHLSNKQIENLLFPIPPIKIQNEIVTKIQQSLSLVEIIENGRNDIETTIKKTKSKILDLAIHGKLVPQDSNDEPASILLEKLRAEKEEKIAKGELKRDKNDSYIYKGSDNCYYQRFPDGHEEDISEEIPCELPESWAWCRIKDICTINPKNKLDDNLEVSFIPMTLIDAGYTNHHGQETRVWKKIKTGFTHFAENDVAIAKISPCFENKKSVILKNLKNGYGAGTTELYILRACSIVLPEYLFWIVKTDSFINEGVGNFSGVVGQQRLARDIVENYYIPLPPINEQKRIISKIVSLFEKLDTIENNIE